MTTSVTTDDWFAGDFTPSTPSRQGNTGAKLFLFMCVAILLICLFFVLYLKVLKGDKSDDAAAPTTTPTPTATATKTPEVNISLENAREKLQKLPTNTSCSDPSNDALVVIDFAHQAVAAKSLPGDDTATVLNVLRKLDSTCPKTYSIGMFKALTGPQVPVQLNSVVVDKSWITKERPAPEGAKDLTDFTTPANNIRCKIDDKSVTCSIYVYDYPSPPGCEMKTATYRVTDVDKVTSGCDSTVTNSNIQPYGTVVAHKGFACTLAETGVECWSELSGHGFALKKAAAREF